MKKLLVLVMFMLMASMVTAGVVWDVSIAGQVITIQLNASSALGDTAKPGVAQFNLGTFSIIPDQAGTWGALSVNAGFTNSTGTSAGFPSGDTVYNVYGLVGLGDDLVADNSAETLWSATYTLSSAIVGTLNFDVDSSAYWKDGATPQTSTSIGDFSIPEPMTMALLGLGGLFLRRRK